MAISLDKYREFSDVTPSNYIGNSIPQVPSDGRSFVAEITAPRSSTFSYSEHIGCSTASGALNRAEHFSGGKTWRVAAYLSLQVHFAVITEGTGHYNIQHH